MRKKIEDYCNEEPEIEFVSVENSSLFDIFHAGTPHEGNTPHSGRYPWGSGENSFQRPHDFHEFVRAQQNKGISDPDIAASLKLTTTQLKAFMSVATALTYKDLVPRAQELAKEINQETGKPYTRSEIGVIIGNEFFKGKPVGESTIRNYLKYDPENAKKLAALNTAKFLIEQVDKKGIIDVGSDVSMELHINPDKLNQALEICKAEGYPVLYSSVPQQTNISQKTNLRVLAPPGTPEKEAYSYKDIHTISDYVSDDNGKSFREAFHYPKSLDSNRVMIRYGDEGGAEKDGLIEIRRGVKDLTLGSVDYAQVRILVDDDYYMKGMAVYSDGKDMPKGVDIIFNSNKPSGKSKLEYLKSTKENLEKDPNNPFGSTIKELTGQKWYDDPDADPKSKFTRVDPITGNLQSLSPINKRAEAGDWGDWSKELPSQFLSKQPKATISKRLNRSIEEKYDEYEQIMEITNPAVKSKLLEEFADDCDKAAVDLKAVPFNGVRYHVILPAKTIGDNEVYAPNFPEGSQVALVRFPHAGQFEIPILTVTHHNKEAEDMIGPNSSDAIVISAKTAKQLSGADFDGDTVLTIPTNTRGIKIEAEPPLKGLENFDPDELYGPDPTIPKEVLPNGDVYYYNKQGVPYKIMAERTKQIQMGVVSNLITDMTLKGASNDELERAVRHSMVVIDAIKHKYDYRSSERDNKIDELKQIYQRNNGGDEKGGGAATLISRAKKEIKIPKRAEGKYILNEGPDAGNEVDLVDPFNKIYQDPKTKKLYSEKDKRTVYIDPKTGEKLYRNTGEVYAKYNYLNEDKKKISTPVYIKDGITYKKPKTRYQIDHNDLYYKPYSDDGVSTKDFIKIDKSTDMNKVTITTIIEEADWMSLAKDARSLMAIPSRPAEELYANYANQLKALANTARKEYIYTKDNPIEYSPEARREYHEQVVSLNQKVNAARLNAPKERAANVMAAAIVAEKIKNSDKELSDEDIRKLRQTEISKARNALGAHNHRFIITEKEWEAIQKGAFSKDYLENKILRFADPDVVRKLATPRDDRALTNAEIRRMKGLAASGESNAAIARRLGLSVSTVIKYLGEKED